MGAPVFSTDDFRRAIIRLLPRGPVWSRAAGSLPDHLAAVWGATFARNTSRAADLLVDAFPATTNELLSEWESSLGLPDPCAGESPTVFQRRNQVIARLTDSGGSSIAYYTAFAEALGYDIAITEYAPTRCGLMKCGDALRGEEWAWAWLVSAPGYTPVFARAGAMHSGERLMTWSNGPLRCEIEARNPAHLIVRFAQSGANLLSDFGPDITV